MYVHKRKMIQDIWDNAQATFDLVFWTQYFCHNPFHLGLSASLLMSQYQGHLSNFIGCLLTGVLRSTPISVQLDHPVVTLILQKKGEDFSVVIDFNL